MPAWLGAEAGAEACVEWQQDRINLVAREVIAPLRGKFEDVEIILTEAGPEEIATAVDKDLQVWPVAVNQIVSPLIRGENPAAFELGGELIGRCDRKTLFWKIRREILERKEAEDYGDEAITGAAARIKSGAWRTAPSER